MDDVRKEDSGMKEERILKGLVYWDEKLDAALRKALEVDKPVEWGKQTHGLACWMFYNVLREIRTVLIILLPMWAAGAQAYYSYYLIPSHSITHGEWLLAAGIATLVFILPLEVMLITSIWNDMDYKLRERRRNGQWPFTM